MNALRFWYDGCDIYIAESAEEADRLYREHTGNDHAKVVGDEDAEPWSETHKTPGAEFAIYDEHLGESIKKTREQWIAERGAGYFASTEY